MPTAVTHWSDAKFTSLAAAMALLFSAVPKIIGFVLILIAGWFIASLIDRGLAALLRSIHFNDLAERAGLSDFIRRMGMNTDAAGMIGLVVKWFVRLIALVVAFDALGLPAVSEVLRQLLLWLPNVVVALVVLVIGGLAARALSNVVRGAASEAGLSNADFLAKAAAVVVWAFALVVAVNQLGIATELVNTLFMAVVGALALGNVVRGAASEAGLTNTNFLSKAAAIVVWAFAIVVAVNQLGIATELVNTLFMAVVGAVALGLGLAFGLGGRETAAEILRKAYDKAQEKQGKIKQLAGNIGDETRDRAKEATQAGQWPTGGYPQGGGMQGGGSPIPADRKHDLEGG